MNLDTKIPPPIVTVLILAFINLFESKDYELNTEWISIIILSMGVFFIFLTLKEIRIINIPVIRMSRNSIIFLKD